jgi:hypothetical protein
MSETEPVIVFLLVDRILETLKASGATLEQCTAALRAAEAILPVASFESTNSITLRAC